MADGFCVKGPDHETVAVADDIEELIEKLEEQEGLADPEDMFERY